VRSLALTGLFLTLATGAAESQQLPRQFPALCPDAACAASAYVQVAPEPGIHSPLLGAAGLGLLGWGLGALTGRAIQGDCIKEFCELEGIFYGGAAGGGLGLAVGAHLGNRRRGNVLLNLVVSGAVWAAGYAAMRSFTRNGAGAGVLLTAIVLPPTQLTATVLVERATGRSRARRAEAP